MKPNCEVCATFKPGLGPEAASAEGVEIHFFQRTVSLCALHAYLVRAFRVTTIQGLRSLFRENRGKRSFVSRRVPNFEEMPMDRRQSAMGRRASDFSSHV